MYHITFFNMCYVSDRGVLQQDSQTGIIRFGERNNKIRNFSINFFFDRFSNVPFFGHSGILPQFREVQGHVNDLVVKRCVSVKITRRRKKNQKIRQMQTEKKATFFRYIFSLNQRYLENEKRQKKYKKTLRILSSIQLYIIVSITVCAGRCEFWLSACQLCIVTRILRVLHGIDYLSLLYVYYLRCLLQ